MFNANFMQYYIFFKNIELQEQFYFTVLYEYGVICQYLDVEKLSLSMHNNW